MKVVLATANIVFQIEKCTCELNLRFTQFNLTKDPMTKKEKEKNKTLLLLPRSIFSTNTKSKAIFIQFNQIRG